jgi:hypothetical protein
MLAAKEAADRRKFLITAIQLDEFWNIDNVPDDEGGKLDKLEDYEAKHSLGSANHDPYTPSFGYLGAVPLTANVIRPVIPVLGEEEPEPLPPVTELKAVMSGHEVEVPAEASPLDMYRLGLQEHTLVEEVALDSTITPSYEFTCELPASVLTPEPEVTPVVEEDVFAATPPPPAKVEVVEVAPPPPPPPVVDDGLITYELSDEFVGPDAVRKRLRLRTMLGDGTNTVKVSYRGEVLYLRNRGLSYVPSEFLKPSV